MAWSSVARCRIVFLGAKVSVRHFSIRADMSKQFGTGAELSNEHCAVLQKCLGSEVYWVRRVLTPNLSEVLNCFEHAISRLT